MTCRRCRGAFARRSSRSGVLEHLLSVAYIYPFRCQLCGHRFRALEWGARYRRVVDRREYERIPTRLPATFTTAAERGEGVLTDLSVAGARLETGAARLAEGERLQLTIRATGEEIVVSVDMVVIRSAQTSRFGLQFLKLSDQDRNRLADLVHGLLRAPAERQ